ncbi:PASTA domain-containing protein [Tessaracoccus antarcticus]|uniref:PASTA domain-containing protein n=2 Tax=Tessaracoccus antarcticus TaxID=2479848 RepID=A0A3M0GBK6_9ACTN|nr:PASTA domain-containing protein [Tessaracoccus antarcticus]
MFVAVSVLSGLLLAGLAVPFTALASSTTKMAADSLQYLPEELETPPQSERSRIVMSNGETLATFFDENRVYVGLDEIAGVMQDAQIAIEDHRFYEHGAIDLTGLGRAFFKTALGDTQGASTLTQQYVKLVQVEAAKAKGDEDGVRKATEVSFDRKIREMRYAMAVEKRLTKNEILERYLNIAYYGDGAYGVEAAAHHYWGTTAKNLTLDQAAMLAGMVQNPVQTNPVKYPEKAMERRDVVLNRMAELGIIKGTDTEAAKKVVFDPAKVTQTPNGCISSAFPILCDYVVQTLKSDKMPSLGASAEERENILKRGGLTIHTLIDPEAQKAAELAVAAQIAPLDPVLSSSVQIQPKTGLIISMAQSRPEIGTGPGQTYYNFSVEEAMNGLEGFQAGSTFKPFVMAAALEAGATPSKTYDAPYQKDYRGTTFKSCDGPFVFNQDWKPKNYDSSYGTIDMMKATQSSVNNYYIQLERDIGICASINMAKKVGVKLSNGDDLATESYNPSFVLGTADVTPLSMAEAYATFANRGVHCDPIILESVQNKDGENIPVPSANCTKVMEPEVADGVSYVLESVMSKGTGRPARMPDGRPQAGKTGTTNDATAVWFAGYTPEMAGVAMIGIDKTNPYFKTHRKSLTGIRVANGNRLKGSGGGDAGKIWKVAMASALKDLPRTNFTDPSKKILEGEKVPVPDVSGMGYNEAKQTLEAAGFSTVRRPVFDRRRKGAFLGIYPTTTATKFGTISMKVSAGPEPKPEPKPTPPSAPPVVTPVVPPPAATPAVTPPATPGTNG